ncbi:putative PPE family protein PPE2 [Mycobacterium sp. MFM001]|uniref:PPE family protein n=1 Tax=Mycobacterium sp. MFM001 TaxID=2049453 RepID=UPI000DA54AF5|nr:PPE family protein [Mycobacterium sp. MFM001]GBE65706.1 putative PPE family protein PPE2 [Mycobacterium sp. MFM001]
MTAPIWMASPPEVHSTLLSSGPGPGSLLAAAGAWNSLATAYAETAEELTAVLDAVRAGAWDGTTAEAYVTAHAPYLAWLMQAAADSAATAAQHETAAGAYTTALATMPTLAELAANHATHAALVATNFFGINTIPIALNEADYVRMWIQAATVMSTYQSVATAAVTATPSTTAAPAIMKTDAATTSSDSPSGPDVSEIQQFLDQIGYTDFYNNFLQPLANLFSSLAYLYPEFPWLPITGNPLFHLSPTNIAWFLAVPLDPGSYAAILAGNFATNAAEIAAALATGNPGTVLITLGFVTVEAIGFTVTDTIQLLHYLIEQTVTLIPVILPLVAASVVPLGAAPGAAGGFAGLAGLAGLAGVPPPTVVPVTPPPVAALAPTMPPSPTPAPAPAPAPASAPAAAPAPPAPGAPPPTPSPPTLNTMDAYGYMVGGLNADARRAASTRSRQRKAPEPDTAISPAPAVTPEEEAQARRRRRAKVSQLGRGYEYMDLEPDEPLASDRGAGSLGFAGTVRKDAASAAGLTRLSDDFGGGARMPMMPGTWGGDD